MSEMPAAARPIRRRVITEEIHEGPPRATAYVCEAASCMSAQAHDITLRLGERAAEAGLGDVEIKRVGCLGLCAAGPLVEIAETGELFERVSPDDVEPVIAALEAVTPDATRRAQGPFFEKQVRVATENFGRVDPESLDDYIAARRLRGPPARPLRDDLGRGPRGDHPQRPARPRRRRLPDRPEVDHRGQGPGHPEVRRLQRRRGRPGRVHGPQRPRERPVPDPRGDGHRRLRGPRHRGLRLLPRGVPARGQPPAHGDPARPAGRLAGRRHQRHVLHLRHPDPPRRGRLRLRRGDGAHRLDRGQARHPAPAAAVPGGPGPVGQPHAHQQRRDVRQRAGDHPQGRGLVRRPRPGKEHGHEGLRPRRPRRQHRPRRGPDGDDPPRDHLRHRRRDHRRAALQGRPDRRPVRRLHPRRAPRHARRRTSRSSSSARSWARAA